MSPSAFPVLDADGHVTESYPQLAKYLIPPSSGCFFIPLPSGERAG